ncbi:MYXO-CTERM domain-containing protein [Paenibacillus sp. GP183]|nr:MYXO-CTERM domain-containing protein [Paenibacillus sp. GP183]
MLNRMSTTGTGASVAPSPTPNTIGNRTSTSGNYDTTSYRTQATDTSGTKMDWGWLGLIGLLGLAGLRGRSRDDVEGR